MESKTDVFSKNTENRQFVQPEPLSTQTASFISMPQDIDFVDAAEQTVNAVVHIRTEMTNRGVSYDDFFGSLREYLNGNPHQRQAQRSWLALDQAWCFLLMVISLPITMW